MCDEPRPPERACCIRLIISTCFILLEMSSLYNLYPFTMSAAPMSACHRLPHRGGGGANFHRRGWCAEPPLKAVSLRPITEK